MTNLFFFGRRLVLGALLLLCASGASAEIIHGVEVDASGSQVTAAGNPVQRPIATDSKGRLVALPSVGVSPSGIMSPRGLTGQKVSVTTTSAQSTAITGQVVDVDCDAPTFFSIGASPTAVVDSGKHIPADQTHRYGIISGDKIAFIAASGTASCWVHPMN